MAITDKLTLIQDFTSDKGRVSEVLGNALRPEDGEEMARKISYDAVFSEAANHMHRLQKPTNLTYALSTISKVIRSSVFM